MSLLSRARSYFFTPKLWLCITFSTLSILFTNSASSQDNTRQDIERENRYADRYNDYIQDEKNDQRSQNEYFGSLKGIFASYQKGVNETQRLFALNRSAVRKGLLDDLHINKDKSISAKYRLAFLAEYEPRLVENDLIHGYSVISAAGDMQELATVQKYPPALFALGDRFLRQNIDYKKGWSYIKSAALLGDFNAIKKMKSKSMEESVGIDLDPALYRNNFKLQQEICTKIFNYAIPGGNFELVLTILSQNPDLQNCNCLPRKTWTDILYYIPVVIRASGHITRALRQNLETTIPQKIGKGQSVASEYKLQGDAYSGNFWQMRGETEYVYSDTNYAPKAFESYYKSYELGNTEAQYKAAVYLKNGYGTEKNPSKTFEMLKQLADKNYPGALTELAECYEKGIGTQLNIITANKMYKQALLTEAGEKALAGILRTQATSKEPQHPVVKTSIVSLMEEDIKGFKADITVVHLWHQGFSPAEYQKTIQLQKALAVDSTILLLFATRYAPTDILGLSEGMGFNSFIYAINDPNQTKYAEARKVYRQKILGNNFDDLLEKVITNIGDIEPEINENWTTEGWPATLVYVKGASKPFYFKSSSPLKTILDFINEAKNIRKSPVKK